MNKKIFRSFCIVLIASMAISSGILIFSFVTIMKDTTEKELLYAAKLVDYFLQASTDTVYDVDEINYNSYLENTRLTIIDIEGEVKADSDYDVTENHLEREEIKDALALGEGYSTRYSKTSNETLLYVAYYNGQYIIRIAMPYQAMLKASQILWLPLGISVIISLLIAFYMAKRLANRFAKPILEISKEVEHMNQGKAMHFDSYDYEEYKIVSKALLSQEAIIQETMDQLQFEKLRIATIIDQMNEGFILLDNRLSIIMVNQKAKEIINKGMQVNTSIEEYLFNNDVMQAIRQVENQKKVDFKQNEFIYSCFITNVEYGVTLLFVDITESRTIASIRQEFFSNVSHELKTPMTAIKGYSELLEADMIQDKEMQKKVLHNIQKEIGHMTSLVNDILTISRLESKDVAVKKSKVAVNEVILDVIDGLDYQASERKMTIEYKENQIYYMADRQHIYQIVSNLISNAIKYNKDNGKVFVKVYQKLQAVYIEVEDTGIGIRKIDQQRVFERFYRCDKARSRKISGTGLGLSIVKHIVQYYKGTILLNSEVNKGTKIVVILPNKSEIRA